MSTVENTRAVEPARRGELVHPVTGRGIDLAAPAPELLDELDAVDELLRDVRRYRDAVQDALVRRVDGQGKRTALVDGCKLQVNPPTEDHYHPDAVRRELVPLVQAGKVPRETLDALIVQPPPPEPAPPPERVDKTVVNTLKASDNRELLAALARARSRTENRRSLKVLGRPVEATAEDA